MSHKEFADRNLDRGEESGYSFNSLEARSSLLQMYSEGLVDFQNLDSLDKQAVFKHAINQLFSCEEKIKEILSGTRLENLPVFKLSSEELQDVLVGAKLLLLKAWVRKFIVFQRYLNKIRKSINYQDEKYYKEGIGEIYSCSEPGLKDFEKQMDL